MNTLRSGLLLLLGCFASAAPLLRKEVTSLPGFNGSLPSRMFNGHIPAGLALSGKESMYFHYWLVESERNVADDPVIVWYNGGPGASSMFGLLQEFGPFLFNDASYDAAYRRTGIPTPQRNPFSWSTSATVVAIDSPAPVGFSYCEPAGVEGNGYACGTWNDTSVADANHQVITSLFNKAFPEFMSNKIFIVGESYAGVYVPMFVDRLIDNPMGINLAGFAVGDGVIGTEVPFESPWYKIEFFHGHGQFSNELYATIRSQCPETDLRAGNLTTQCNSLLDEMNEEVGGYYEYNLYDDCVYSEPFTLQSMQSGPETASGRGANNGYPCPGTSMKVYLNRTDVRMALGVDPDAVFFDQDGGDSKFYVSTEADVRPIYAKALKAGLRTLVYNGDTDPGINSFATQDKFVSWAAGEGLNKTQRWRPWTIDGKQRVGGYVTEWEGGAFSYVTIRGSGHMVPEYKPAGALSMIQNFVAGHTFPRYVKPAVRESRSSRTVVV